MTDTDTETDASNEVTNETTARFATEIGLLALHSLQLIGITGPEDARRALLRTPAGQIQTVRTGDRLRQGRVVAISESAVILDAATGQRSLQLPKPAHARAAA